MNRDRPRLLRLTSPQPGERGSVSVVAATMLGLVLVLVLMSVDVLRTVEAAARGQTAADAAALAAAQDIALPSGRGPEEFAREYASRNGAMLVSCRCDPNGAEAVVQVESRIDLLFVGRDRTVRSWARAVIEGRAG